MLKRSIAQILEDSKKSSLKLPKRNLSNTSGFFQPCQSKCPSSNSSLSMGKTRQLSSTRKRPEKKKPKPSCPKPGAARPSRSRDLSVSIKVPPHKRLRVSLVKDVTLARYSQAVQEFETWASVRRRSLNMNRVDKTLLDYLHEKCESGMSIVNGRSAVYGYIMLRLDSPLPERMLLTQCKEALKGWSARFPLHSRAGVDLQVWDVLAWQCIVDDDPLVAAAILLQGDTYMRPHEILHVRACSVLQPKKSRARCWGIVIGNKDLNMPTKTGLFDDCVLLDTPSRTDLGVVLKYLLLQCEDDNSRLFQGLTLSAYNRAIKNAAHAWGLDQLSLTPHVLRHSGPSSDAYHRIRSMDSIQQRGRWASPSSVARYQKPGRMLLLHQKVPQIVWNQARRCRTRCIEYFQKHLHKNA